MPQWVLMVRSIVSRSLWAATIVGACIGTTELAAIYRQILSATAENPSAPQVAAQAGLACAWAILPYVFTRAFDELTRREASQAPR